MQLQINTDHNIEGHEALAAQEQKELLKKLSPLQVKLTEAAGEKIQTVLTHAPRNGAPIGALKVMVESGCLRRVGQGPRISARSRQRAFGERIICAPSWRNPRPAADYTARLIPCYDGLAIPLEAAKILWQR